MTERNPTSLQEAHIFVCAFPRVSERERMSEQNSHRIKKD